MSHTGRQMGLKLSCRSSCPRGFVGRGCGGRSATAVLPAVRSHCDFASLPRGQQRYNCLGHMHSLLRRLPPGLRRRAPSHSNAVSRSAGVCTADDAAGHMVYGESIMCPPKPKQWDLPPPCMHDLACRHEPARCGPRPPLGLHISSNRFSSRSAAPALPHASFLQRRHHHRVRLPAIPHSTALRVQLGPPKASAAMLAQHGLARPVRGPPRLNSAAKSVKVSRQTRLTPRVASQYAAGGAGGAPPPMPPRRASPASQGPGQQQPGFQQAYQQPTYAPGQQQSYQAPPQQQQRQPGQRSPVPPRRRVGAAAPPQQFQQQAGAGSAPQRLAVGVAQVASPARQAFAQEPEAAPTSVARLQGQNASELVLPRSLLMNKEVITRWGCACQRYVCVLSCGTGASMGSRESEGQPDACSNARCRRPAVGCWAGLLLAGRPSGPPKSLAFSLVSFTFTCVPLACRRRTSAKRLGYVNELWVDPASLAVASLYLRASPSNILAPSCCEGFPLHAAPLLYRDSAAATPPRSRLHGHSRRGGSGRFSGLLR